MQFLYFLFLKQADTLPGIAIPLDNTTNFRFSYRTCCNDDLRGIIENPIYPKCYTIAFFPATRNIKCKQQLINYK